MHVFPIDRYADESFVSPSGLGASLRQAIDEYHAHIELKEERDDLQEQVNELEQQKIATAALHTAEMRAQQNNAERQTMQQQQIIQRLRRLITRLVVTGLIIVLIAFAWAVWHIW